MINNNTAYSNNHAHARALFLCISNDDDDKTRREQRETALQTLRLDIATTVTVNTFEILHPTCQVGSPCATGTY